MLVSLIVPTLNEKDALQFLLQELAPVFNRLSGQYQFEMIIVDDGSTDGTRELINNVTEFFCPLKLLKRDTRGLASAVVVGMRVAQGEIVGVMDADLSHPPQIIPKLLGALADSDLAIASRHIAGGGVENWPLVRRLFSKFALILARPVSHGVKDPLSGFFFLKKAVVEGVKFSPSGYKILLEIIARGKFKTIAEIPYIFRNRDVGKSKLNLAVAMAYFYHLARVYALKLANKK